MKRFISCSALIAAVLLAASPVDARERGPGGGKPGGAQMSQQSQPQKSSSKKKSKSKKSRSSGTSFKSSSDRYRTFRVVERPSPPPPRRGGITFFLPF